MAQSLDFQAAHYQLPVYSFRVTVGGLAMSFAEVSGIRLEYQTVTYRHGMSFQEGEQIVRFSLDKYFPVTLKRGVVRGGGELYDWLRQEPAPPRVMEVSLCGGDGTPLVTWRLGKVVPVKLEAPGFDAKANEVAVESLEVMAATVTVVHHTP